MRKKQFDCIERHRLGTPFRNDGWEAHGAMFNPDPRDRYIKMMLVKCKDCDKLFQVVGK